MVRNIIVISGNSHPHLTDSVCSLLGIAPGQRILSKFSGGESRCEIKDSVRGKDVFILQSGGGAVNDHVMELCISEHLIRPPKSVPDGSPQPAYHGVVISACKMGSAKRVTAIMPLFPYSRQPDLPYHKSGAPLSKSAADVPKEKYTFESVPPSPGPGTAKSLGIGNVFDLHRMLNKASLASEVRANHSHSSSITSQPGPFTKHDYENINSVTAAKLEAKPGYKRWVAQAGTLIADLLTCAGADQ